MAVTGRSVGAQFGAAPSTTAPLQRYLSAAVVRYRPHTAALRTELLVLSAVSATWRRVLLTIDIEVPSRRPMNRNVDAPKAANEAPPAH